MNNYTIPCIHPLSQEDTELAVKAVLKVVAAGCGNALAVKLNKTGQDVYELMINLGFITFEKGTVH